MCKQKQDIFVIQKEIFKTVTIETVIDSVKDNLPSILGVVGASVVIYFIWSNWPPRKPPRRKPPNKNESDDDFRHRVRKDIIDTHGPALRNMLDRIRDLEGYAALDDASRNLLDNKLNSLYDTGITRMVNNVTKFTNELRIGTHDYENDIRSAGFGVTIPFRNFIDFKISSYNEALAQGPVDNQTFLQYFDVELARYLLPYLDLIKYTAYTA